MCGLSYESLAGGGTEPLGAGGFWKRAVSCARTLCPVRVPCSVTPSLFVRKDVGGESSQPEGGGGAGSSGSGREHQRCSRATGRAQE